MLQSINELETPSVEPPLKKFKSLFEESDPNRLALSLPSYNPEVTQESHLEHLSLPTDGSLGQEEHWPTIDGDEASQDHTTAESRGTKRRADTEDTGDGPLSPGSTERDNFARPQKRRMMERASTSIAETNLQHLQPHGGAKLGEPDTDTHFLTALASMKRGKGSEDSFDREFNNLKISKPDLEREVIEKEWDLLDEFDDEHNVRGNFMLVVELEAHKKGGAGGTGTMRTGRIDWEGKPDFKKFRKVCPSCVRRFFDHRTNM